MKFTRFLEDDKKTPSANGASKPSTISPKLYRRSRETQVLRISLLLTFAVLILSLLINLIFLIPPQKTSNASQDNEVVAIDETELSNGSSSVGEPVTPEYETMPICSTSSTFKSWMDYRKITNTSTRQWRYQQIATTDEYGFRTVDGYYMVAMAKQYGPVGTKYIITFSGGQTMPVIIGDLKANTTCQHPDGSMIEMIVDSETMPSNVKRSGNYNSMISGTITEIRKVEASK